MDIRQKLKQNDIIYLSNDFDSEIDDLESEDEN